MSGLPSSPVGPLALPLARWTGSRSDIHLEADASQCPLLLEADVVGRVVVDGHADVNPRDIVVSLQVRCATREICGRSLEEFEHPLDFPVQILLHRSTSVLEFQWEDDGDEAFEASISEHLRELDISEVIRQAVVLERPISPIKPGTPLPEGVLEEDDLERSIDPRWDALRQFRDSEN
jgi:uncharacterized metal-binding protein YceD (DUF177 family)